MSWKHLLFVLIAVTCSKQPRDVIWAAAATPNPGPCVIKPLKYDRILICQSVVYGYLETTLHP